MNSCLFWTRIIIRTLIYLETYHIQNQRYIQKPGIFKTLKYLEPCYIQNPCIFRNRGIFRFLIYSEPWHIRTMDIFRSWGIFRTLLYSEPEICSELEAFSELWHIVRIRDLFRTLVYPELYQTSMMERFTKTVNSYNYFHNINFSHYLLCEINMTFFNLCLVFTTTVYHMYFSSGHSNIVTTLEWHHRWYLHDIAYIL